MTPPPEVETFRAKAEAFCAWAERPSDPSEDVLYAALCHVAQLYAAILLMPGTDHDSGAPERFVDKNAHEKIYDRFKALPFQYYGEVFDSTLVPPDEPTLGDVADDLLDIYTDVKAGLVHYAAGDVVEAAWQWKFTWGIHWGRHATSALRALHIFLVSKSDGAA